eukprot:GFUD01041941.1.p1 GENE.GFUD01041941.1~~GFUD01041941.1.p1  ORF type:complete len:441 (+),score=97.82 GFUD01041941.1:135-1457(+)
MGLVDFQIIFDNPMKVYFSGQTISGRVLVNLSEHKKMARIKVQLVGRGEVHWTESRREHRRDSRGETFDEEIHDHYRSTESYLDQEAVVYHGPSLQAGTHLFPFTFLLPSNLPSSFESKIGHVRYFVKTDIVRDWMWNHKVKQHITVNGILDLNLYPSAKQAGHSRDYKNLCCLCCKSGPISAVMTTNRTGYVPGELIGFCAEVDNQANKEMTGSFLNLVEVVTFKTARKNKTERRVVAEIRRGRIAPKDSDMWEGVLMRVPALPPTNLAGTCNIIDVQYKLDFHVDPSGMSFDLVVSLPITIGTIPLMEYIPTLAPPPPYPAKEGYPPAYAPDGGGFPPGKSGYPPQNGQAGYPPMNSGGAPPPSPWNTPNNGGGPPPPSDWNPSAPPALDQFNLYPNLPPPTYSESVWGVSDVRHRDDDEHTMGDFQFVPRYVLYNTN